MAILKRRFGNPYAISQAWVDKVLNLKDIKDNKQLQSFADILCSCRNTLKAMKCEEELNGGRTLLQIVEKLPEDIKKRWLTINYEIIKSSRLPKLDDIVSLVQSEAAKRADPIFGNLLSPACSALLKFSRKFKWPKCIDGHFLNQCRAFRTLSFQKCLAFVQQKQLCLNVFMKGHRSTVCTRSWVCKVHGCGKKHNSWMHTTIVASNNDDKSKSTNLATGSEPATDPPHALQAHATRKCIEASRKKIALPILPVVVSDRHNRFSMNVFALLDTVDLRVEDAQQRNSYLMKGVLCWDHLNISLDNFVTHHEVFQWPHLKEIEISLPEVDLADEIHLLIGLDQPDILAPRETHCGCCPFKDVDYVGSCDRLGRGAQDVKSP
ncbi:unnamed protein product [Leuciscus chuanchicus]